MRRSQRNQGTADWTRRLSLSSRPGRLTGAVDLTPEPSPSCFPEQSSLCSHPKRLDADRVQPGPVPESGSYRRHQRVVFPSGMMRARRKLKRTAIASGIRPFAEIKRRDNQNRYWNPRTWRAGCGMRECHDDAKGSWSSTISSLKRGSVRQKLRPSPTGSCEAVGTEP